jgi:predicted aspartyl protease
MMPLRLESGLLFVSLQLGFRGRSIAVENALLDTGAASTVITTPLADALKIVPEPTDSLRRLVGIGGVEWVYTKHVDYLQVGTEKQSDFEIEISGSDYGFGIDAILGTDFLLTIGATINLKTLTLGIT